MTIVLEKGLCHFLTANESLSHAHEIKSRPGSSRSGGLMYNVTIIDMFSVSFIDITVSRNR